MKILLNYILRNIRENKLRGLLILFSLMVSTFILFLNFIARDDIIYKYEDIHRSTYGDYDLIVTKDDSGDPYFRESEFEDGTNVKEKLSAIISYGIMDDDGDLLTLQLYGINRDSYLEAGLFQIGEEDDFKIDNNKEVLISPQLSSDYDYELGDTLSIQTQVGLREYKIGAIAEETGLFLGVDNENLIVMADSEVEEISSKEDHVNSLLLNLPNDVDLDKSIDTIEENNQDFNVQTLVDQDLMDFSINMVSQILVIILLLVMLLNYYVISSNAKVILLSRIPLVGTFRSLGASKAK